MKKDELDEDGKPITYSVPVAGRMAGLGPYASYKASKKGQIPTIRLGRRDRVPGRRWRRLVEEGFSLGDNTGNAK